MQRRNQQPTQRLPSRNYRYDEREGKQEELWEYERSLLEGIPIFDDDIDETLQERQLEQYQLERMTTPERQAIWEENHINQLQEDLPPRASAIPINDWEQYSTYRTEQLWEDELEQIINIDETEKSHRFEQYRQNEELRQKNQWEDLQFVCQQLQQPSNNDH